MTAMTTSMISAANNVSPLAWAKGRERDTDKSSQRRPAGRAIGFGMMRVVLTAEALDDTVVP